MGIPQVRSQSWVMRSVGSGVDSHRLSILTVAVREHFPGSVDFAGGVMLPYSLFAYKVQNPAMRLLISQ